MYQSAVIYNTSIEFPIFGTDDTVYSLKGIYTILFICVKHLKPHKYTTPKKSLFCV